MSTLSSIIREKQEALVEAEARVAELRAELQDAKELLLAHPSGAIVGSGGTVPSGNSTEWAESVLREAGKPLHVNAIIPAIERKFGVAVRYATLVGNISRLVKKEKIFERVDPNVFGLRAWKEEHEADALFGAELREEAPMQRGEYEH